MQKRRALFLVFFLGCLFLPSAAAYWLWSPADNKLVSPAGTPPQKVTKKSGGPAGPTTQKAVEKQGDNKFASLGNKISQGAAWFWSPTQGRFISAPGAGDIKRTAEEQYQHALKLRQSGKDKEAIRELGRLTRQFPQSAYAPEAQYLIASLLEEKENYLRAAAEFQKLIHEFPRSERIDEAVEHLFKLGNLFLSGEKQKIAGVALIPVRSKAVDVFRFIVEAAPFGPYGDQAQLRLGIACRKIGNFEEAIKTFETLIANYPTSSLIDEAHYQLAETSYELSQNTISDQRTLNQAAAHLKEFIKGHAASTLAERARLLKQQLDEQDAEKNYRIGLYYEKQGFIESALIYYEDVANRYSQTIFGQKTAQRLQTLKEPALAMAKGEESVERRIAEVRSLLQALGQEERKKDSKAAVLQETAQLRGQLEAELATLTLTQKRFQEDTVEKYRLRRRTFRDREKNLREKFKIFKKRRKSFRDNPSPELEEVFQKWHNSLVKEQEELAKERRTLETLGLKFKGERISWWSWVPYVGRGKTPSEDHLIEFREEKWGQLEQERAQVVEKRQAYEKDLAALASELIQLDQKEFEMAKTTPLFQELFPSALKKDQELIEQKKVQWNQSIESFEAAKKEYAARYGEDFIKTLLAGSNAKDLRAVEELIASGGNIDKALQDLQKEKASLGEAWLDQKEKLNTMVKAFGQAQTSKPAQVAEVAPLFESLDPEEQAKAARLLKKRIKYVEREMRSRMDQIQDWEMENAGRMEALDRLLHPKSQSPRLGHTLNKAITPAKGTYKLARAFLFGLPHRERELMQEAAEKVGRAQNGSPSEALTDIQKLRDEIELQSILIQGRMQEISELEKRLAQLQKQAKQIPGFTYQTMLVQRFPFAAVHSFSSARELLGEENQEAIFVDRVNRQTRELEALEKTLAQIDQKIEVHAMAAQRLKGPRPSSPGVATSMAGDTETLPTETVTGGSADEERQQWESKLVRMKTEIDHGEGQYQKESAQFEKALFKWYQTEVREKFLPTFSSEGKAIVDQKERLSKKQREIETSLTEWVREEYQIIQSQKEFLDQKEIELRKRLSRFKDPYDSLRDPLEGEIKRTVEMRDSLIREISSLESSLKTQPR